MNHLTRNPRLHVRQLRLWQEDYLVHRYLWPNLATAIGAARKIAAKPEPRVLDVGCGNKPYRDCFGDAWYVGLNYSATNSTPDLLGDGMALPFGDATFDIVFASQVLEHLSDPMRFTREAFRVLVPGGAIVLSCPFYWPLHEEPYDYFRFTRYGLAHLVTTPGFDSPTVMVDGRSWAQVFLALGLQVPYRLRALRIITNLAGAVLDRWFGNDRSTANYSMYARKPLR